MTKSNRLQRTGQFAVYFTIVIAISASSVFAQSPTFARVDYQSLANNHVLADFNGDGKLDLAGQGAMTAAVMLGNGNGTFGPRAEYPVASWNQDLAAGDFNRDGHLDLVFTINDSRVSLSLLTGNGNGTFNPPVNVANTTGLDSPTVVATDLDNDGSLDVVIGHAIGCYTAPCITGRSISMLRGNGDGTFQPSREITVGTGISRIAVGDFNRDGRKDLAIAGDRSQVYVLLGAGDGTFTQQPTITLIAENNIGMDNTDIDVADLNGDTFEDLVVALSLNGSKTAILLGRGDGTFGSASLMTEPGLRVPQYQAVADYNGDGALDLAIALANGNEGLMEIRNGNGNGTFQSPVLYLRPPSQSSIGGIAIVAADFNGDGKSDIALGWGGASSGLAALTNTTGGGGTGGGGGGAAGFNSPTANARDSGGDGNGFDSSPSNAFAVDGRVASDFNSGTGTGTSCTSSGKDRHRFFNYDVSIPSGSSIAGIEVRLDARADSTSGSPRMCVQLSWDGGATWTAARPTTTLGTSTTTFTLGSASDTWGRTWTASDLSNTRFRVRVINVSSSTSRDFFLDWIAVRPHLR
jgi:hypothetical protein